MVEDRLVILKPELDDYKIVGYYLGRVVIGVGLLMFVPFALALAYGEYNPALDYLFGIGITLSFGLIISIICHTDRDLSTMHAMSVASLSWLAAMFFSAVPLYFSGHFVLLS